MIRKYLFGFLIWLFYRSLMLTWRFKLDEPRIMQDLIQKKSSFILAHWHGDELVLLSLIGRYKLATITSTSKDGEMMNTVVRLIGGVTSRGSSTRGGIGALRGLLRLVKDGRPCSFAVDGPKGPIHVVKPGVFEFAKLTKVPIFVSGVAVDRAWHFPKSWNKTYLPKPFSRIHVTWSGPIEIGEIINPRSEELRNKLADALHNTKSETCKKFDVVLRQ